MRWRGIFRYLFTGVGALVIAGGAYLALGITQADPALASSNIAAGSYSYTQGCNVVRSSAYSCANGPRPGNSNGYYAAGSNNQDLINTYPPTDNGQFNPEISTAQTSSGDACGDYWYAYVEGSVAPASYLTTSLTTSSATTTLQVSDMPKAITAGDSIVVSVAGATQTFIAATSTAAGATSISVAPQVANYPYDANGAIGATVTDISNIYKVNQWYFIAYTPSAPQSEAYAYWYFLDQAPVFIPGWPQTSSQGGSQSYPNGNPAGYGDDMGFSIEGHATVWVGFESPDVAADPSQWKGTSTCSDFSPIFADEYPSGYAISNYYVDNQAPPAVASTNANLAGTGTNLNSSNPTLEWDFTGVTDNGSGSPSLDANDYYVAGTQYYTFTSWLDQNNLYETSPPAGSETEGQANLTSAIALDSTPTTLAVTALNTAVSSGDNIELVNGANYQDFTATANSAIGSTSISINPYDTEAFYNYPVGTQVIDLTTTSIGAGESSGYPVECTDGGSCKVSSPQVAVGYTSHFCIDSVDDWLNNNNTTLTCSYEYIPNDSTLSLTPANQTLPDTEPGVLTASSSGAPTSESLILGDTTTGTTSVVTEAGSVCTSNTVSLTSALSTSSPITSLPVSAVSMNVGGPNEILLTSGSHTQIFTTSLTHGQFLANGATAIPVDAQTPNYAYPIGTVVANTSNIILTSGEELILTNAGDLSCYFQAAPVGDGTYNYAAELYDSNSPSSFSAQAQANITWSPWSVSLTGNDQTSVVTISSGSIAQLIATADFDLGSPPQNQELEIFPANSSYVPTGSDLLASACTAGITCPSSGYVSASQPSSTSNDCISATYLDSCYVAEIIGVNGVVLASSNLEVEWQGAVGPIAPGIEAATSPGEGLAGAPQSFWVVSPATNNVDNPLPETQTETQNGVTYTLTPEYVDWYFGDAKNNSANDDLTNQVVDPNCQPATANQNPNPCNYSTGGVGYGEGVPVSGNSTSSITHIYQEATNSEVNSIPTTGCSSTALTTPGYQWCAVLYWNYTGTDGSNGSVTSLSPTYSLQVSQVQGQYGANPSCTLAVNPSSGEAGTGTSLSLIANNCPVSVTGVTPQYPGTGNYQFAYEEAGGTTLNPISSGSSNKATMGTSSLPPGEYYILLYAGNSINSCGSPGDGTCEIITDYYVLNGCSISALTTSLSSPQPSEQSVTLTATASCASSAGSPEYEFSYTPVGGSQVFLGGYSASNSDNWNTTAQDLAPGTYTLTVSVYPSSFTSSSATSKSITYVIGATGGTCSASSLSSSPASTAPPGTRVTLNATVTCPSGVAPSYGFFYTPNGSSTLNPIPSNSDGWSLSPTATWNTTGLSTSNNPYTLTLEISSGDGTTPDNDSAGTATESFILGAWTLSASQSNPIISTNGSDTLTTTASGSLTGTNLSVSLYSLYPSYSGTLLSDSPSCYWLLNETSGNTANSYPGTSCSGSYSNMSGYDSTPGPLSGLTSQGGAVFNGTSSTVTSSLTTTNSTTFSYNVWFKTVASNQGIFSLDALVNGNDSAIAGIWLNSLGDVCSGVYNNTYNEVCSSGSYNNGTWTMVTMNDNTTTGLTLYVNGALSGTNATNPGVFSNGYTFWAMLGNFNNAAFPNAPSNNDYGGTLADASWFAGSFLSASQISALYTAGTATSNTTKLATCNTTTTCSANITESQTGYYALYATLSTNPNITSNILTLDVQATCTPNTLTASPNNTDVNGATVALSATATCSQGAASNYAFFYTPAGGTLTGIQGMSSSATATWNTTGLPAGNYTITVETQASGASGGSQGEIMISYVLTLQQQTITFTSNAPTNASTNGATYTPTAVASSGLQVSLTIDASSSSVCSIDDSGVVSYLSSGTCTIDANQQGNAFYAAAPQVQQSFVIQQTQTITFTSAAPTSAYVGGPTYTPTASASSGLAVSFSVSTSACTISSGVVSFVASGTCTIDANQQGNANYTAAPQVVQSFTVNPGPQTITFTSTAPNNASVQAATYTVSATASSGLTPVVFTSGDAAVCTSSGTNGSIFTFIAVGTCIIDANQAGNINYNPATQAQQSFSVAPGNQTVAFISTAPTNATVSGPTYSAAALAYSATGTDGQPITFSTNSASCTVSGSTVSFVATGSCILIATQNGSANYYSAYAIQTFTVNRATNAYQNAVIADGPADFWPMYDTGNSTAVNLVNGGAIGSLSSGVTENITPGIPNATTTPVMGFNGSTGEITASPASITGSFTVSAWFKLSGTGEEEILSSRASGAGYGFDLQVSPTVIHGDIGTDTSWLSTAANATVALSQSIWYQVTYVVSPTGYAIYLNGHEVGSGSISGTPVLFDSTHVANIGDLNGSGGSTFFSGDIADVAIFSSALTSQAAGNLMESTIASNAYSNDVQAIAPSSILGYWPLSDIGDEAAADLSGNGNAGELTNGVTTGVSVANTPGGVTAENFPDTSSAIPIAGGGVLNIGNANFTIMAWIYPTIANSQIDMIFTKDVSNGASDSNWEIRLCGYGSECEGPGDAGLPPSGDEQIQMVEPGGSIGAYIDLSQQSNTWSMVTAQYTASSKTYQLYLNGTSQGEGGVGATAENNTGAPLAYIGARADGTGYFSGDIADVAIWNTLLSTTQINTLYSDG